MTSYCTCSVTNCSFKSLHVGHKWQIFVVVFSTACHAFALRYKLGSKDVHSALWGRKVRANFPAVLSLGLCLHDVMLSLLLTKDSIRTACSFQMLLQLLHKLKTSLVSGCTNCDFSSFTRLPLNLTHSVIEIYRLYEANSPEAADLTTRVCGTFAPTFPHCSRDGRMTTLMSCG